MGARPFILQKDIVYLLCSTIVQRHRQTIGVWRLLRITETYKTFGDI